MAFLLLAPIVEKIPLSKFQTLTKVLKRKAGKWITEKAQAICFKKKIPIARDFHCIT